MTGQDSSNRAAHAPKVRARTTEAITAAVLEELVDSGYDGMSIEAVARRAGVGKAAIYRRWSSKEEMVQKIVGDLAWSAVPIPDTGSLRGDIADYVAHAAELQEDMRTTRIIAEIGVAAARNVQLAQTFYKTMRLPRRKAGAKMLARAAERGELPEDIDTNLALDCLVALAYARPQSLTETGELKAPYDQEQLVDVILTSLPACRRTSE